MYCCYSWVTLLRPQLCKQPIPGVSANLCYGVSQSNQILQPFCSPSRWANSWWSLLFDCWGFNALVNHKTCRCTQANVELPVFFSVDFTQPLSCIWKDILKFSLHTTVSWVTKLRSEFTFSCDQSNPWFKETNCPKSAAHLANYPGNCPHSVRVPSAGAPEMEVCTIVAIYKS